MSGNDLAALSRQAPEIVANEIFTNEMGDLLSANWTTWYGDGEIGGHGRATWRFKKNGNYTGENFDPQANVRIAVAGVTCFEGEFGAVLPESDGETITMTAIGHGSKLKRMPSIYYVDAVSGDPDDDTYYPSTLLTDNINNNVYGAWEYAQLVMGLDITLKAGTVLPTTYLGDSPVAPKPLQLSDSVLAQAQAQGKRVSVWRREMEWKADDYNPADLIVWDSPIGFIGMTGEDYASDIYVWYVDTAPGTDESNWSMIRVSDGAILANFDPKGLIVDYRGLGVITAGDALALGQKVLGQLKGRYFYNSSISVDWADTTFPRQAWALRSGEAFKLNHLRTSVGRLIPEGENRFIIGETDARWDKGRGGSTSFAPMGATERDLASILKGVPLDPVSIVAGAA